MNKGTFDNDCAAVERISVSELGGSWEGSGWENLFLERMCDIKIFCIIIFFIFLTLYIFFFKL